MELYAGLPYWLAKNPLFEYFNPLREEHQTEIAIIGSGITGALVAHELCRAGHRCSIIEKHGVSGGSSTSSTALLQYEIDTPLHKLTGMIGEEKAVKAYLSCLEGISDIKEVFRKIHYDPGFSVVPSIFYASRRKDMEILEKEYAIRKKYNFPVELLRGKELSASYGINKPGALVSSISAQMDTYEGATAIISHHMKRSGLQVFTNTEITECTPVNGGYVLSTEAGHSVKCSYVIIATGFEAGRFLPEKVMDLTSTYAIASHQIEESYFWRDKALLWETAQPYLYIRTAGKRIIVGGEDDNFKNEKLRDRMLDKKAEILERKFRRLFPGIPFKTDMKWCGTFSSTKDGLPFIGPWKNGDRMMYVLGYGGNGITFSIAGAQMITNIIEGKEDERLPVFGFERLNQD